MDTGYVFVCFFWPLWFKKRRQSQQAQEVSEVAQQAEQEGLIQVLLALVTEPFVAVWLSWFLFFAQRCCSLKHKRET